jgi:hypothetical protein
MNGEELQSKVLDGAQALAVALTEHAKSGVEYAEAEVAYRKAQAMKYLEIMAKSTDGKKPTEAHIKAMTDLACEKEMLRKLMAEANRETANERVRCLRTEISAFQSVLSAHREEAAATRYGQGVGA